MTDTQKSATREIWNIRFPDGRLATQESNETNPAARSFATREFAQQAIARERDLLLHFGYSLAADLWAGAVPCIAPPKVAYSAVPSLQYPHLWLPAVSINGIPQWCPAMKLRKTKRGALALAARIAGPDAQEDR